MKTIRPESLRRQELEQERQQFAEMDAEIQALNVLLAAAQREISRLGESEVAYLARENEITHLRKALERLANEAEGFLGTGEPAANGRTNINALRRRIEEARVALAQQERG